MQRVATELHTALRSHPDVDLSSIVLRSSWRLTHLKTGPFLAHTLLKILQRVRRGEVDVVLFSSMVSASLSVFLQKTLREYGVYTAAIVHGRDVTLDVEPYQRFVPIIFDALDAVLPVSHATASACLERGIRREKLSVVPNGVSMTRFRPDAAHDRNRSALLERFGDGNAYLAEEGLLLCSVGRQVKRKGFAWFIEHVLPLLPPDVHYWLAGDGPEGERIMSVARRRGVADRVRLLGRVSEEDLELLYLGSDLFIMPNVPVPGDMEGFGVVMLEAGLCGLPTIASRLEGITDVIEEDANGRLVASGDAWGFSEAIMGYHHEPEALREARLRAASYVAERFSWRAVADQYVDVISSVVRPVSVPGEEALV